MYFDTAYIAKFYLNEPESRRVRELVKISAPIVSSNWAVVEFHCVLHRRMREGLLLRADVTAITGELSADTKDGLWRFSPTPDGLLRRTGLAVLSAPDELFLRAGDAVHLMTAQDLGENEIWTNDRHMKSAAPWFGLTARSL